jgi:selenocysteine lyase/cysteine desulfurase
MDEPIYVNNAGTSWPKAPGVVEATHAALAASPAGSQRALQDAYSETCSAFGVKQPERVLLTGTCTQALALLIQDLPLEAGDVVLTSALEHHALARPVQQLSLTRGVLHEIAPYSSSAPLDLDFVRRTLRGGRVKLVALSAASNVTGERLPIEELGQLAHEHGVPVLLDAAQTAGVIEIDVGTLPIDMLVFAGHKGPLAPHGVAGFWVAPHVELRSPAALCELTGSSTESAHTGPAAIRCTSFPSGCDVGSVNLAAAAGLAHALRWHRMQGNMAYQHARELAARLRSRLRQQAGCRVFGSESASYTATVSFLLDKLPLERAESYFGERGVALRAGQHCAPLALQSIGAPEGTVRVSFGPFNRDSDVDAIATIVAQVARGA